jgi:hypothetical protein
MRYPIGVVRIQNNVGSSYNKEMFMEEEVIPEIVNDIEKQEIEDNKNRCDICGGDSGEDDLGPFEYEHKLGCPDDPNMTAGML